MERALKTALPVEIRRAKTPQRELNYETLLTFGVRRRLNGTNFELYRLGDRHYTVAFSNVDFPSLVIQKLTLARQYETEGGKIIFRGVPIISGDKKYLSLQFDLKPYFA